MLVCLTNAEVDGMLVISRGDHNPDPAAEEESDSSIQYVMLNPGGYFKAILKEARSVLLLGGTLQPFSYLHDMLFPHLPRESVRLFSCDHIVDSSHICALVLSHGPLRGQKLEITFETRLSAVLLEELHNSILEICEIVPFGIVIFFTSYAYMNSVIAYWKKNGLFTLLENVKNVFVEQRGRQNSSDSQDIWHKYSAMATKSKKGIHFF